MSDTAIEIPSLREAEALAAAGSVAAADAAFRALHRPQAPDAAVLLSWARLRRSVGDLPNAAALLQQAVAAGGGDACVVELAGVLTDAGRPGEADRLLRGVPGAGAALAYERGRVLEAVGRGEMALAQYRAASRADPKHMASRLAAARLLARAGKPAEAEAAFRAMLQRAPADRAALGELAWLLGGQHRFREALECYDRLEATGADIVRELSMVVLGLSHVCAWSMREALRGRLEARFAQGDPGVIDPYAVFALSDDPRVQRNVAGGMAAAITRHMAGAARPAARGIGEGRLRIGYLCGDLNQHATSLLLAGVIEAHDRARFKVFAYDYSREDGSATRTRMIGVFERFERLGVETPVQSAARIAADGIDILVDLNGYTERTRSEILALRPAPVQLNFLGYVATQAGDWTDYVIADRHVLPESALGDWTEQPVWMPASAYPSDRSRPDPPPDRDRAKHGLPDEGVVFGCFNNPFKLSPEMFAIWMRLLREVPGSVLWLYEGNPFMAANLRREAVAAGIEPGRLVFAPPVPLEAHIARHGCLDVFLDSFPYGAHTTAMDALWAGVPMITYAGRSFTSRVGASLLHAVGMPELIARSLEEYAALAVRLARDPARLATLRARLAAARTVSPLFDAVAFCRALERGYLTMAERARAGMRPAPIRIDPEPGHG